MLDDLPKGRPHTYAEIMTAMTVLHKMLIAQSHAYGGKNSRYIPAGIAESSSLLKNVSGIVEYVEYVEAQA